MADTSSLALAIPEMYWPTVREYLFLNDELLSTLAAAGMDVGAGLDQVSGEGNAYTWPVHYAGNTAVELFTEHQSAPTPGYQSYAEASLSWVYAWGWWKITRMSEDALRAGQRFDAMDREMMLLLEQIKDLRTTTYLGSTNNGLLHAVSNTGTYATIVRSSSTWFQSTLDSTSEAIAISVLDDLTQTQRDPEKRGKHNLVLTSSTQRNKYARVVGYAGASNAAPRIIINQGDSGGPPKIDLGIGDNTLTWENAPVVAMPDFTASEWLQLDFRAGNIKHRLIAPFEAIFYANQGDAKVFYIRSGGTLVVEQTNWQARHSNLTT